MSPHSSKRAALHAGMYQTAPVTASATPTEEEHQQHHHTASSMRSPMVQRCQGNVCLIIITVCMIDPKSVRAQYTAAICCPFVPDVQSLGTEKAPSLRIFM
ncbi:hypothetical protein EJ03DRAFT_66462 [Teratosphaeria nubilosa]|uniref:Uncharacterized protein n=1 Tax=Teratosphaeria nubilosa TaxID=161662 RepID=A0A6G1LBX7_9PEZI|nr:hypothetical protein EJ03DRAFT_66462 [Teratosphaeria nubilosa]